MDDELLTTGDVSAWLKIPRATLRTWRYRGYGPRSFTVGGAIRYRRSAVEAWLAEQERATTRGRTAAA